MRVSARASLPFPTIASLCKFRKPQLRPQQRREIAITAPQLARQNAQPRLHSQRVRWALTTRQRYDRRTAGHAPPRLTRLEACLLTPPLRANSSRSRLMVWLLALASAAAANLTAPVLTIQEDSSRILMVSAREHRVYSRCAVSVPHVHA